jgi:hypothetical protein
MQIIEGRIAAILSEALLVINIGADAGVREGMIFTVLAEGNEVKDPDTGATLGKWEMPKGHVRATHVQPKMATCEAFDPTAAKPSGDDMTTRTLSASMITASMRRSLTEGAGGKLNVRRGDIQGMPEIGPIQVGDRVRAIVE